jgi:branched-chain amino acid transport system ATP-binding protein
MKTIQDLQSDGVTILLVEQNAQAALSLADRGYVLEVGQIMFSDTGKALLGDDRVKRAYLGAD